MLKVDMNKGEIKTLAVSGNLSVILADITMMIGEIYSRIKDDCGTRDAEEFKRLFLKAVADDVMFSDPEEVLAKVLENAARNILTKEKSDAIADLLASCLTKK